MRQYLYVSLILLTVAIAAAALLLQGCGRPLFTGNPNEKMPHSRTERGNILVRHTDRLLDYEYDMYRIDETWRKVQVCLRVVVDGGFLKVKIMPDDGPWRTGGEWVDAVYYPSKRLIVVGPSLYGLDHEMAHFILYETDQATTDSVSVLSDNGLIKRRFKECGLR
jgi:hypothetical protein